MCLLHIELSSGEVAAKLDAAVTLIADVVNTRWRSEVERSRTRVARERHDKKRKLEEAL